LAPRRAEVLAGPSSRGEKGRVLFLFFSLLFYAFFFYTRQRGKRPPWKPQKTQRGSDGRNVRVEKQQKFLSHPPKVLGGGKKCAREWDKKTQGGPLGGFVKKSTKKTGGGRFGEDVRTASKKGGVFIPCGGFPVQSPGGRLGFGHKPSLGYFSAGNFGFGEVGYGISQGQSDKCPPRPEKKKKKKTPTKRRKWHQLGPRGKIGKHKQLDWAHTRNRPRGWGIGGGKTRSLSFSMGGFAMGVEFVVIKGGTPRAFCGGTEVCWEGRISGLPGLFEIEGGGTRWKVLSGGLRTGLLLGQARGRTILCWSLVVENTRGWG